MNAEYWFNTFGFYQFRNDDELLSYYKENDYIMFCKISETYKTNVSIDSHFHHLIDMQMEELGWFEKYYKSEASLIENTVID